MGKNERITNTSNLLTKEGLYDGLISMYEIYQKFPKETINTFKTRLPKEKYYETKQILLAIKSDAILGMNESVSELIDALFEGIFDKDVEIKAKRLLEKKANEVRISIYKQLGENFLQNIKGQIDTLKDDFEKTYPGISNNPKIKSYWTRCEKGHFLKKQTEPIIKEVILNEITIDGESVEEPVFSKQELKRKCTEIFRNKILQELYIPTYKKEQEKKVRKKAEQKRKTHKNEQKTITPPPVEITQSIEKTKENLFSKKQLGVLEQTIEYFTKLAKKQSINIDKKELKKKVYRAFLNQVRKKETFEIIAQKFKVVLPQKNEIGWKPLRSIMAQAKEHKLSEKGEGLKEEPKKQEKQVTSLPIKNEKDIDTKQSLYDKIKEQESFEFDDFEAVIKSHNGYSTNQKAFQDFQKEFDNDQQRISLLHILKNRPTKKKNIRKKSDYYRWALDHRAWHIVADENKAVKFFYQDFDKYRLGIKEGKF